MDVETQEKDDIGADIGAAFDKLSAQPAEAPVEAAPMPEAETPAEPTPEAEAPAVEVAPKPEETPAAPAKGKEKPKPGEKPAQAAAPTDDKPAPRQMLKAPQSWTPAAREKWATLPADVQKEVDRREREHKKFVDEAAEDRKFATSIREKISPFEPMIRALGAETPAVVEDLLRTAYNLRIAPAHHKAAIVASIIQGQGVDPNMVAAYLQGQQPPAATQQPQALDPSALLAKAKEEMRKEYETQQAQAREQQRAAELEAFASDPSHEFFDDVRDTMADLITAAAHRGLNMSWQEAYDRACKLDPEISQVLQQREAAKQANAANASTQRAKIAASSVPSRPAGVVPAVQPDPEDLHGALLAAFAAHEGR